MLSIRRGLQVLAFVGTLLVGTVALALIVSQTAWFRDWLRRFVVRESKQYLNGELSIGGLTGNLLFGIGLTDVAVDVSGQRVVAVKALQVDYSVFQILSSGIVIDDIKLVSPNIVLERDANGWNLGRLVKKQAEEADRKGPGRPISLPSIELTDGTVTIDDKVGSNSYRLPSHIDGLHLKGRFEYAPVHYTIGVDDLRFRGTAPDLTLQQLAGGLSLRDDNLYLDKLNVRTGESAVSVDGVIEQYLKTPVLKLAVKGHASLPELARVAPAVDGYDLKPEFTVTVNGPADRLGLDLDVASEAGNVKGQVTADLAAPDLGAKGTVDLTRLNLAPLVKDPAQHSDLTGRATFDLVFASAPEAAPALDRLRSTFAFEGPTVVAAGYSASDVKVSGQLAGPRITLDGRAAAYGGTATADGFIVLPAKGRALAFDLKGRAAGVDLRRLPASTGVPKLASRLAVSAYHVTAAAGRIEGSATLLASTVEGITIAGGTTAEFATSKGNVSYAARGEVSDVNLQRVGQVFKVAALDDPRYASRLNGPFDVKGAGRTVDSMTLDATGTLRDSDLVGAHLPELDYEAHLNAGALDARAKGRFEHLDPGHIAGNPQLNGSVTGTADVHTQIADISAPITPETINADGVVKLESSKVGELQIDTAAVEGRYANQVGDLTRLSLASPDVKVEASGRVALDAAAASDLKYHVDATNLSALATLAGQEGVAGSAVLDGTLTGNRASLKTTGTMNGSGLGYQENSALDVNAQYTVTVPDLQFAKAQVTSTTAATFVKVGSLELNEVKATTTYQDTKLDFAANLKQPDREVDVSGDVVFHPDHQEIHLPSLALRTQGVEWRTAPGSAAAIRYGNDRVEMQNVKLVSGDQSVDVDGAFALKAPAAADGLRIQVRNVDIAQIEKLAMIDRGLTGRVEANAIVNGTSDAPVVSGTVAVDKGGFQTFTYDSLKAKVDFDGKTIGLDATLQQNPTQALTAQGKIPMTLFQRSQAGHVAPTAGDELDLHVTSTPLSLGIIQGFTTAVSDVTGQLVVDVRLTGAGEDPHVEGIVDIQGGGFAVPLTGVSYSGLSTSIALSPDRITIPNLQIVDEEGERLTISGSLGVHARQVGAVDVTVQSSDFELLDNELGKAAIATDVKLTGELRRPKIVGTARLPSARLEVDKILALFYDPYAVTAMPDVAAPSTAAASSAGAEDATRQALSRAGNGAMPPAAPTAGAATPNEPTPADAEPAPASAGAFAPVEMDLKLTIPENLVLRGKSIRPGGPTGTSVGDLNITVGGNIDVTKAADAPLILLGEVDTVRGTYQFQGRRFDLVRGGTIRFTGEEQINPLLDVTATRLIPNTGVEARVHITGSVKAPELELTSDPPLDESDILALIVFNRPVNELGSGERTSLAATAGGIAGGFIASPLGESIGKALDLDLFEITTTTDTGDLGAGITVGQQVGDRAFLKLRQQFGERTTTEFTLEYSLTSFLRMQANGAPETSGTANRIGQRRIERAGIDLIFFFSY